MPLPGPSCKLVIPDYGNRENYQAFLDLMELEHLSKTKPWEELVDLQKRFSAQYAINNIPTAFVSVTASRWKSWCDARQFEYSQENITCYGTWLHITGMTDDRHNQIEKKIDPHTNAYFARVG